MTGRRSSANPSRPRRPRGLLPALVALVVATIWMGVPSPATAVAPPNDDVADATVISSLPFDDAISTVEATESADDPEPSCVFAAGPPTVWYEFTPDTPMAVHIDTNGSNFDTVLAVYRGDPGNLTEVGCDGDGGDTVESALGLAVEAGVRYLVMVTSETPDGGQLELHATAGAPLSTNDDIDTATAFGTLPFSDEVSTLNATEDPSDPDDCISTFDGATVWYEYTPSADDLSVAVESSGDGFTPTIAVYRGSADALVPVACGSGRPASFRTAATFTAEAGSRYLLLVGTFFEGGDLTVTAELGPPPPDNDDVEAAIDVGGLPAVSSGSAVGATRVADDPTCAGGVGPTVWYSFTPQTDVFVRASTDGSTFDTTLSAYAGSAAASTELACNDDADDFTDTSAIGFAAAGGVRHLLMIAGSDHGTGDVELRIDVAPPPPSNDELDHAVSVDRIPYSDAVESGGATRSATDPRCGRGFGSTVWYELTPETDGFLVANTFDSDVDTTLSVHTGDAGSLVEVACNDDFELSEQSLVSFAVTAGVRYLIMVEDAVEEGGTLALAIDEAAEPPPNERIEDATPIDGIPFHDEVDTSIAVALPSDPTCSFTATTVWYRLEPSEERTITIDTSGSSYPTDVRVLVSDPDRLRPITACDLGRPTLDVRVFPDEVYYVMVAGETVVDPGGDLVFDVTDGPPPPVNDDLADAEPIDIGDPGRDGILADIAATAALATRDADDPTCVDEPPFEQTLWYSLEAEHPLHVRVDAGASAYEPTGSVLGGTPSGPVLAAFARTGDGYEQLACRSATSLTHDSLSVALPRGEPVLLVVGNPLRSGADVLRLSVSEDPPLDDDVAVVTSDPLPVSVDGTAAAFDGSDVWLFGGGLIGDRRIVRLDPATGESEEFVDALPAPITQAAAVFDGSDFYVFGGADRGTPVNDILRVDPDTAAVEHVGDLPYGRFGSAAVFDGRYAYVIGGGRGRSGGPFDPRVVRFDPTTDGVDLLSVALPAGVDIEPVAAFDGDVTWLFTDDEIMRFDVESIDVVGGPLPGRPTTVSAAWDGTRVDLFDESGRILRFDPATSATEVLEVSRPAQLGETRAFVLGDAVYVLGDRTVNRFDPGSGAVQHLGVGAGAAVAASGAHAYALGGAGLDQIARIDRRDGSVDVLDARLPSTLVGASAVTVGRDVYVVGGFDGEGLSDDVLRFDPRTRETSVVATLPQPRVDATAVTDGDLIYVVGGISGGGRPTADTPVVQIDPRTGVVTTLDVAVPGRTQFRLAAAWAAGRIYVFGTDPDVTDRRTDVVLAVDPVAETVTAVGRVPELADPLAFRVLDRLVVVGAAGFDPDHARAFALDPVTESVEMLRVSLPTETTRLAQGAVAGSDIWLVGSDGSSAVIRFRPSRSLGRSAPAAS